jgi:hypothetical protein
MGKVYPSSRVQAAVEAVPSDLHQVSGCRLRSLKRGLWNGLTRRELHRFPGASNYDPSGDLEPLGVEFSSD